MYVEPYGGGASVLLRKVRTYTEIYNDLADQVVNVFKILRDPELAQELTRRLYLTPFSRTEFELSRSDEVPADPVERARLTILRSFAGFGSNALNHAKTGFRSASRQSSTAPAVDWRHYPAAVESFTERLRGVAIEQRDALEVMAMHDGPDTLHYVDPPYVHSTRSIKGVDDLYEYEYDEDGHRSLVEFLQDLKGMVVVSGYQCDLYDEIFSGWQRRDRTARADKAGGRVESLWLNTVAAGRTPQPTLFESYERA